MSLPKKKSRLITINNHRYKWLISPNDGFNTLTIEKENIKGSLLIVHFKTDINSLWLEVPPSSELNLKVLKPKDVELIIRQALATCWHPEKPGTPMAYDWKDGTLKQKNTDNTTL